MSAQGSPVSAQAAVPSPCINVCRMHAASGLCEGCQRTLAEIGAWASMGEAEKREVWRQLEKRREACMPSRLETRKDCP